MHKTFRFVITAVFGAGLVVAQAPRTAEVQLKAAEHKQEVEGDLKGAIAAYQKVVAAPGVSRKAAADALVRMGQCYEKLGDAESRKAYERVVREFADQKDAVAMARARLGGSTASQNAGIVTKQVWTGPKVDIYGAASSDGRLISITDWSTGDLALHDLTTGQDRRLTNKGTWNDSSEYATGSVFSRDGKQLVYGWTVSASMPDRDHSFELRVIDVNGGKPRVLFSNRDVEWMAPHDWSQDGKWLAVHVARADHTGQIGLVSTTEGTLRVLKSVDWGGASKMAFSPDGKYLAYDLSASDVLEQRDIHVMAVDGSRETPAVVHPANDKLLGWSPEGNHLLFASDRNGRMGVWALPIADGKPRGGPELIKSDINPGPMGLTRSGALYYSVVASGRDIYVASEDIETGKVLAPPTMVAQPYVGFNDFPEWSPDGKYLAFLSRKDPNSNSPQLTALAIWSKDTGKVRELRPNLAYLNYTLPLWSSDSSFLIVNGTDRKGRQGIYRVDTRNGETAPLVMAKGPIAVAAAPDGRTLYINITDTKTKETVLLGRDMQTGKEREIARRIGPRGIALSPDGRLLAVLTRDSQSSSLLLFPAGGGEPRELLRVSSPEALMGVRWAQNSEYLIFAKPVQNDMTRREQWRIPAGGGAAQKMDSHIVGRGRSWHPDGRQFAFAMGETKLEIWAMENFLPTLTSKK